MASGTRLLIMATLATSLVGVTHAAGLTSRNAGDSNGLVVPPGIASTMPVRTYQKAVGQELYDQFGPGRPSRSLYCDGSVAIGFQIKPDGTVANVKLLHRNDPAYNGPLVAKISNMTFPRFTDGMDARPIDEIYRFGVSPLSEPFLKQRYNCR